MTSTIPNRYLVHHWHQSGAGVMPEEVWVGYNTTIGPKEALSYAIHTASRYGGEVFAEYEGEQFYQRPSRQGKQIDYMPEYAREWERRIKKEP